MSQSTSALARIPSVLTSHGWRVAVAWMLGFGALHTAWAMGSGLLLPGSVDVRDVPALLAIDLIAIPLCLGGAAVGWLLRPGQRRSRLRRRWWLRVPAGLGVGLMVGHFVSSVVILTAVPWAGGSVDPLTREVFWRQEPLWLVGVVAMALTLRGHTLAARPRAVREQLGSSPAPVVALAAVATPVALAQRPVSGAFGPVAAGRGALVATGRGAPVAAGRGARTGSDTP